MVKAVGSPLPVDVVMEILSGACVSVISEEMFCKMVRNVFFLNVTTIHFREISRNCKIN